MFINFFRKCLLLNNVEEYFTAGETTDDNIMRRMRLAFWVIKATNTHLEYVILIAFYGNIGYVNTPRYYVYTHVTLFHYACKFIVMKENIKMP